MTLTAPDPVNPALSKRWGWPQWLTPYAFLSPALGVLTLTVFWPALQAFYLSFTDFELVDLTQTPQWVGLKNFISLTKDPNAIKVFGNTFLYLICVVPVLVVLSLALAIFVNQKLRGITWFRAAYYSPVVISMVVAGLAWKWLLDSNGLLNQGLKLLGFTETGFRWLSSPDLALFSVMAVTVWKGLGYYMVIYLAGLQSVPEDLYEAAAIDGSDGWKRHWDITIPLMKPYVALVAVISAISATKVFEEVYIMTRGQPLYSSATIVYYLYEQAFGEFKVGYACAMGLVLFLVVFSLSILNLKLGQSRP
jgi:putative chitobiose transport system permease protein